MNTNAKSSVRFALYLAEPIGMQDALHLGQRAEEWGYDTVAACQNFFWWETGEAPVWDIFTVLTALASRTQQIDFMTNIVDPFTRHPAHLAHTVATFDNIWPGRLTLGIGPGEVLNFGPLVDVAGRPPYRMLSRTREYIEVVKGVWGSTIETPFNYNGDYFQLENAHLSMKPVTLPHPPIYIAAMGPKMKRLTGEMGNGWTPITYTPTTYTHAWQEIATAATQAGRDPNQIGRALTLYTVILDDRAQAVEMADSWGRLDLVANPRLLEELGYGEFADSRFALENTQGISTGQAIADKLPSGLGSDVTIGGTAQDAIARIEAYIAAGVERFIIWPPYGNPSQAKETLTHLQKTVLPHFNGER